MAKLLAVDFYRGVAIIMIIMVHTSQVFNLAFPVGKIASFGDLGCQIFFTVSAFCLCLSYEGKRIEYKSYICKRLKKIAPAYWVTIALSTTLAYLSILFLGENVLGVSLRPLDIIANIALVHGLCVQSANNHVVRGGWFVGTLIILYALFPMIYGVYKKYMTHKTSYILLFSTSLCVLNSLFWLALDMIDINPHLHFDKSHFFYFSFINQMSSFLLGIYMYSLYKNDKRNNLRCILLFFITFLLLLNVKYGTYAYSGTICPFLASISFVYLFELTRRLSFESKFSAMFICNIGRNSYYVYLLNTFVAWELGGYIARLGIMPDTLVYLIWFPVSVFLLNIMSIYYKKVTMIIKL